MSTEIEIKVATGATAKQRITDVLSAILVRTFAIPLLAQLETGLHPTARRRRCNREGGAEGGGLTTEDGRQRKDGRRQRAETFGERARCLAVATETAAKRRRRRKVY